MENLIHVYIDESGDLGKFGSKYFIIVAVIVKEQKILERIIKKLRQRRLKKKIKELPEIKANNSNRLIREYVLKRVKNCDCQIIATVAKKDHILDHLFKVKNKLYNYLCGILMEKISIPKYKIIITIDKKHTNTLMREDFNRYIKLKFKSEDKDLKIEIYHKPSITSNELQVVDFVAWSISRKFNSGDDFYYRIIEDKIINKKDMLLWKE